MESTVNQIYILTVCMFTGILGGILYEPFFLARKLIRLHFFGIIADVLFFVFFGITYVFISVMYDFPAVRPYMLAGALAGLLLYLFSLHRIVAFLIEKLYNNIKNKIRYRKRKLSGKTNEGRKV